VSVDLWAPSTLVDDGFDATSTEGRRLVARGDAAGVTHLAAALRHGYVAEGDYVDACRALGDVMTRKGAVREALTLAWYVRGAAAEAPPGVPPIDRARTLLVAGRPAEAAALLESSGYLVRAAIAREKAGDFVAARALWSRLAGVPAIGAAPYEAALAHVNVLRMAARTGDTRAAREAAATAVHLAEEAADRFESSGQRERAFDCHQVVAAVGRETQRFEYVLDGSINVIRILLEDHLRSQAIDAYEAIVTAARAAGETVAAATLAHELADYAEAEGQGAVALSARRAEADLWRTVGRDPSRPVVSRERALLAAALALADAGQLRAVGDVYRELSTVASSDARRDYFAAARGRYETAKDERRDVAAPAPREPVGIDEVWHLDLLEWEAHGSAAEACADVLLDPSRGVESRRRALVTRLVALSIEAVASPPASDLVVVAEALAPLELYEAIAPLEHLAGHHDADVRAAAVTALGRFFFKRTFITMAARLSDGDDRVASAAARSTERLAFPHAIDPLSRIVRSSLRPAARIAALRALSRIERTEAAEVLIATLSEGDATLRKAIVEALAVGRGRASSGAFVEVARKALPRLPADARRAVLEIFAARGVTG
jgi:hypothetical protein